MIISPADRILVTGASGFLGSYVVQALLDRGFREITCMVRPSSRLERTNAIIERRPIEARVDIIKGNLLSRDDCEAACKKVKVIYHLAAGTGEKSFPDAYMNSVVATRNLLEAAMRFSQLRRFVLVSSFAVYSNRQRSRRLDESCPLDQQPHLRGDAYAYAKLKQEQIVLDYAKTAGISHVIVRPGSVYGPGKQDVTGRVGLGTFGLFLHLGGSNTVPFTYVENCADAVVLAGLVPGVDGDVFNVVDDHLPTSRRFLRQYKRDVKSFRSVYLPHTVSYCLCCLWEKYSRWSDGQLPLAFTEGRWYSEWRKTNYSNEKIKAKLGWSPAVSTDEGLRRYFASGKAK